MKRARDELEELFEEDGTLDEFRADVQKKVLADDLRKAMKAQKITPARMARKMGVSRPAVYRLLDGTKAGVSLDTLIRASDALDLHVSLRPLARPPARPRKRAA